MIEVKENRTFRVVGMENDTVGHHIGDGVGPSLTIHGSIKEL
jgi:hypothetical protein